MSTRKHCTARGCDCTYWTGSIQYPWYDHPQDTLFVEHGKPSDYTRLHQEQLTLIKATIKDLKLLIIDEVSMVSSLTTLYLHLRLTEVTGKDELFGGISVIFFADLLQLPQ